MNRASATKTISAAVGAFFAFGLWLTATSGDVLVVPTDRSITVAEYTARGLPSLDKEWSTTDVKQAWEVLQALYAEDPALLPRYRSARSGPVFDKLLAQAFTMEAVFAAVGDVTFGELETISEEEAETIADLTLLSVYKMRPETGLLFDREMVEILAVSADQTVDMWEEVDDDTARTDKILAEADASGREEIVDRIRENQKRFEETLASFEGLFLARFVDLVSLAEVQGVTAAARDSALAHADRLLSKAWDRLSEEARSSARELLAAARAPQAGRKQCAMYPAPCRSEGEGEETNDMARLDDQYVSLECPAGDITLTLAKSGNFSLVLNEWDASRMTHTSERRLEGQWALDGDTLTLSSAIAELVYSHSTSGLDIAGKKATIDTYMWEQSSQPTFADSVALLERVALDGFLLSVTPKR